MDIPKKSLFDKLMTKQFMTPYEAIILQNLNRNYLIEQVATMIPGENSYLTTEHIPSLYTEHQLKQLLRFQTTSEANLYDSYQWSATALNQIDTRSGDIGYKGIALLNELHYMRDELFLQITIHPDRTFETKETIFGYTAYSQTHQKRMTFNDILLSFGENFQQLVGTIDIVLTLNYYLHELLPQNKLNCLKYLTMWLCQDREETNEDESIHDQLFNPASLCQNQLLLPFLEINHPHYVAFLKEKMEGMDISLPMDFEQRSLQYVRETIQEMTGSVIC